MATISDVLQQQHEEMRSAADMMMSLEEIHMVGKVATIKTCQKVKEQQKKKQLGPTKMETKKVTKIKRKCFFCGEKRHWKSNWPKSQNKKEQGNVNYLETCLSGRLYRFLDHRF